MSYIDNMRTVILRIKTTREALKTSEVDARKTVYFGTVLRRDAVRDEDMFQHNCTRIQEGYIRVPFTRDYIKTLTDRLTAKVSADFEVIKVETDGQTAFVLPSGELLGYIVGYPVSDAVDTKVIDEKTTVEVITK